MNLECGTLRIVFQWQADRFAHRVEVLCNGQFVPAYESLEGMEQAAWPPSPPLQSLHFEERPNHGRVALLVGMAGRSHWSASVGADPATNCIAFDVACRAQETPEWLGSTYRIVDANLLARVPFQSLDPQQPRISGGNLVIDRPPGRNKLPCTVRWRYEIASEQMG